jgi:hypothetical protein
MRTTARVLTGLAVMLMVTAWSTEPSPIYLRGYYRLYDRYSVWRPDDGLPWYIVKEVDWADPRLLKWGYVPVMHAEQPYYCLIDHDAPTGSHIPVWIFACGDPDTVELLYNTNRPPFGLLYGGPY